MTFHAAPGARADDRLRLGVAGIERLDAQPVIGAGDELLVERRTLEHAVDELEPLLARRRREFARERQVGVGRFGHRRKVPRLAGDANFPNKRCKCHARGGSFSMPAASSAARASRMRRPAMTRSGAISASGTRTNARSNMRGWGRIRSGSSSVTSS